MKLNILNMEEEKINFVALVFGMLALLGSFIVVVGFLDGNLKDYIALAFLPFGVLLRILEQKIKWFKKYAKYVYMACPSFATVIVVVSNDGKYAAITQFYFMWLIIAVAYCDVKMVVFCSVTVIASNIGALILFPEAMLKLDNYTIWFYIFIIYLMETFLAVIIAKQMRSLIEQAALARQYEDELSYFEQLEKKEEKHREFLHNLSHYFKAIGELAREEQCGQILNLVEELNLSMMKNERIIYTSHKVVNAVLSEKTRMSLEKDIIFDAYVEPGVCFGKTADSDLVAMLGNLLDNAIEAAQHCIGEKRKVILRIFMEKEGHVCVMKLINCFAETQKPLRYKSGFLTYKNEKGLHGIGVKSVKKTAEKYGGYLQCLIEEESFTAILILPVQKSDISGG